jgi:hypothetical protein
VGAECLTRDIPVLVLLEVVAVALLVLQNCVVALFRDSATRIKWHPLYLAFIATPLRVFHALVVLMQRAPGWGVVSMEPLTSIPGEGARGVPGRDTVRQACEPPSRRGGAINKPLDVEALLAKAQQLSEEALHLHPRYHGKLEVTPKCAIRGLDVFALWYTPGVAAPCCDIAQHPE